jgi:glucose-6-phosphate isomerase
MGLTFGLVLLPSLKVGKEFVKTHGHYHSSIPGVQIGFPEVYTHYFGDLYLFMQRREPGSNIRLDDCVVFKMKPGRSITIPPGYAHILINPSGSPALMGGLYSPQAAHDYGPIRQTAGGAYYFISDDGLERTLPNPCYEFCPPLRALEELTGTSFAPPDDRRPLWSSFIEDPQRYAFINDPDAAKLHFQTEDQSR